MPESPPIEADVTAPAGLSGRWVLALYAVAAVALTWPLAVSSGTMPSTRPDALVNLWNFWWVREAVFVQGLPLYATDFLHYRTGVDLGLHTLSIVNSIPGGLLSLVAPVEDVFRWLTVTHYALSGFTFYLLARYVTRHPGGAFLAGLTWTFSAIHLYFIPQLNLSALEFLPLFVLAMMKSWREGGVRNALGVAACAALLAAGSSYYLVYGALLGFALLLGGRSWAGDMPWKQGATRLLVAGGLAAAAVLLVIWPLASAVVWGPEPIHGTRANVRHWNDLLGFRWLSGVSDTMPLVSWPTMFGWTTLAVLIAGIRGVVRQRGFLVWSTLCLVAFVLGLGSELSIRGEPTGITLPDKWIGELPVLGMLRAAQRMVLLMHLCLGILLAAAWRDLMQRLPSVRSRHIALGLTAALFCMERNAAPLPGWPVVRSAALEQLADDVSITTVIEVPFQPRGANAWHNHAQTIHAKRQPGGYVTNLALSRGNLTSHNEWDAVSSRFLGGDVRPLRSLVEARKIDAVILDKYPPRDEIEEEPTLPLPVYWAPFSLLHDELVLGRLDPGPFPREEADAQLNSLRRLALKKWCGDPLYEDDRVAVFKVP